MKKKVKVKTIQKSKEEGASDEQEFKEEEEPVICVIGPAKSTSVNEVTGQLKLLWINC